MSARNTQLVYTPQELYQEKGTLVFIFYSFLLLFSYLLDLRVNETSHIESLHISLMEVNVETVNKLEKC